MKKITVGMNIAELPTPSLIVDLDKMERNIASWQKEVSKYNCALRPHIKTHKIPDIVSILVGQA